MIIPGGRTRILLATLAVALGASIASARMTRDERRFPHRTHEKLFPTCTGCHAGIAADPSAPAFPAPEVCTGCHNGTDLKRVSWNGPAHTPSNLRFDHVTHARVTRTAGDSLECLSCHGEGADVANRPWMVVRRAPPESCIGCHAHQAPAHFASAANCETCHVPLTRAVALTDSAVATIPKPPSHDAADWISTHRRASGAELARCAVCHSRESCARCHVNAASLAPVVALGSDPRVARLVRGRAPSYPVPESHRAHTFVSGHGSLAKRDVATCANCHAQSSCLTCHIGPLGAKVIAKLPRATPGTAGGVQLRGPDPATNPAWPFVSFIRADTTQPTAVRVHPADFARAHGAAASSGQLDCAGCHQQRFCTSCHQGAGERRYHEFNFVARHASTAYARETSCTSCHNTETFCRACHVQSGVAGTSTARRAGAAHGAQPLWLLQHGQAARQGLANCAGCHQQTDCLRCHSTVTQRVNPHGPDFDARRMQARNRIVCSYCHLGDPLK